jgi:hypothetical protein
MVREESRISASGVSRLFGGHFCVVYLDSRRGFVMIQILLSLAKAQRAPSFCLNEDHSGKSHPAAREGKRDLLFGCHSCMLKAGIHPDLSFLRGFSRNPWGCGWFEVVIPAGFRRESITGARRKIRNIFINSQVFARGHDNEAVVEIPTRLHCR